MYPVYGMAEATLAVTFPPARRPPLTTWVDRGRCGGQVVEAPRGATRARGFTALGAPVRDMEVRIVNEAGSALPADRVGEIEIRGAAVTPGYLGSGQGAELAGQVTGQAGQVTGPAARGGWLATGDLGFLHGGDLHVTGRRKEMIIIRGENYYPEDAEAAVRDARTVPAPVRGGGRRHRRQHEVITVLIETPVQDPDEAARLAAQTQAAVCRALDLDRARGAGAPRRPRCAAPHFQRQVPPVRRPRACEMRPPRWRSESAFADALYFPIRSQAR